MDERPPHVDDDPTQQAERDEPASVRELALLILALLAVGGFLVAVVLLAR